MKTITKITWRLPNHDKMSSSHQEDYYQTFEISLMSFGRILKSVNLQESDFMKEDLKDVAWVYSQNPSKSQQL